MAIGLIVPILLLLVCLVFPAGVDADATAPVNAATPTPTPAPLVHAGIDVDVRGNSGNALGVTQDCNGAPLQVGDTVDVDVFVRGVPEYRQDIGGTGISLFQVDFVFDPSVIQVNRVWLDGPGMVRTGVGGGSEYSVDYAHVPGVPGERPNTSGPPGKSGDVFVSLGSNDSVASGDGVLVRLTLQAVGQGASHLDVEDAIVDDNSIRPYRVETSGATVAVGLACSAPTPTAYPTATAKLRTPTPRIVPPTGGAPSSGGSTWPTVAALLGGVVALGVAFVVGRRGTGSGLGP